MSYLPKTATHPTNVTRFSCFVYRFFQTKNSKRDQTIRSNFQTFIFVIWRLKRNMNREINFVFCFIISTTKNDIKKFIEFSYFVFVSVIRKSLLSHSSPELLVMHVVHVYCFYYVFILHSLLQLLVIVWVMSLVQNPFVFAGHNSLLRIICNVCQTMLPLCNMYDVMLFLYGVKSAFVLHDIILIAYNLLYFFQTKLPLCDMYDVMLFFMVWKLLINSLQIWFEVISSLNLF